MSHHTLSWETGRHPSQAYHDEISLESWRLQDHSRQDPWNSLYIHKGEITPITKSGPIHRISDEEQQGHSNYHSTAANDSEYLADTRAAEIDAGSSTMRNLVRHSVPPRLASFSLKYSTTPALPPCRAPALPPYRAPALPPYRVPALPPYRAPVQNAGLIKEVSQPQPPLGASAGERTQRFSAEEEKEDINLVQGMRVCKISRESNVRVSL